MYLYIKNKKVLLRDIRGGVPPPRQVRRGGGGVPRGGVVPPVRVPPPAKSDRGGTQGGVPPSRGTPPLGYPPGQVQWGGTQGEVPSSHLDLAGVHPLGVDRQIDGQTRVKTLPSHRTTYAVGNKTSSSQMKLCKMQCMSIT